MGKIRLNFKNLFSQKLQCLELNRLGISKPQGMQICISLKDPLKNRLRILGLKFTYSHIVI